MQPRSTIYLSCWFCLGLVLMARGQGPFPVPAEVSISIEHAAVSGDGLTAAVSYEGGGELLLIDIPSGLPRLCLTGHNQEVRYITFDEENNRLLSVTDEEVILWSLPEGMELERIALQYPLPAGPREYLFDPARKILYCSVGSLLLGYSLQQEGLAKPLELKSKGSRDSFRAARLAQSPSREDLWALDLNAGELHQIDLTHFRSKERVKVPGAIALAVENGHIAVLATSPDRAEAPQQTVHLFNEKLEKTGIYYLTFELPEPEALKMHFIAPQHLSITCRNGVVDLNLPGGQHSRFIFGRSFEKLFFREDGSLVTFQPHHFEVIDQWGRCQAQFGFDPGTVLLFDEAKRRSFLLQGGILRTPEGHQFLELDPEDRIITCADLRDDVLAIGDPSGSISLYDLESKKLLRTLERKGRPFSHLLVMPARRRVAAFTVDDRMAVLMDWEDGSVVGWMPAGKGGVTAMATKGDSLYLADETGTVSVFDLQSGNSGSIHKLSNSPIRAIAAGDKYLLTGGRNGISAFGKETFNLVRTFIGHDNAVRWLELEEGEEHLLSIAGDETIRYWSLETGHLEEVLKTENSPPERVFFLSDTSSVLVSTVNGDVFPTGTAALQPSDKLNATDFIAPDILHPGLAFNDDGTLLAVLDPGTGIVSIWETARGTRLHQIRPASGDSFSAIDFFDRMDILIGTTPGSFEYWDARTGKLLKQVTYEAVGLRPEGVIKSPKTDSLWAYEAGGNRIVRMHAATGDIVYSHQVAAGEQLRELALSSNGRWLAAAGRERLYLFDKSGVVPKIIIKDTLSCNLSFSPDGQLLAYSRGGTGEVIIYDIWQEKIRFSAPGQGGAFLDDRRLVVYRVTTSGYSAFDIWDCLREGPVATLDIQSGIGIGSIASFSRTGMVVTADAASNILFWAPSHGGTTADIGVETRDYLIHAFPLRPDSDSPVEDTFLSFLDKLTPTLVAATSPAGKPEYKSKDHVVTKTTSLRSGAGASNAVIVRLPEGARVQVVEEAKDPYWVQIRYQGHTGWAKKALLEKERQTKETL